MPRGPIVALLHMTTVPIGNNSADELSKPSFDMEVTVVSKYFPAFEISDGVTHGIPPPQYRGVSVAGVPPLRTSAQSEMRHDSQSGEL